jgi:uncharacterized phage protein (TIGR01671 family)
MRTIKFRAWTGKEMRYDVNINDGKPVRKGYQWFNEENDVHDSSPLQYIGFSDKSNKEIYEGDIVEIIHPCWSAICETKFIDGAFWFIEKNKPENNSQVRSDKFLNQKWDIKIIGNIYETSHRKLI